MSMDPYAGSVATWRKSRHSMTNGNCVEIAADLDSIFVRDSASRVEAAIRYSARAWEIFLDDAKIGKYESAADLLRSQSAAVLALRPWCGGS
jgi:hypothetical protein